MDAETAASRRIAAAPDRGGEAATVPARRWVVLGLLCTAQLLVVLDGTIVNIALPAIQRDLGFSNAALQWVVNGYLVAFGGLLLLSGRAADLFVRRHVFLAGLVVFSLASLACGLSITAGMLIASRVMQGAGAALMSASALSILVVTFTGRDRNLALGVWGGISGAAGGVGVILGGALTSGPGWPWVFFISVPIGLAVAAASLRFVAAGRAEQRPPLDPLGALTVTAGVGLLIFGMVRTEQHGWGEPASLAGLAGAAALLGIFVAVEARHQAPLVPLGVFRLRNVSGGNACALLSASAMLATFFFVTLYMQRVLGYSPLTTGVAYLPMIGALLVASALTSNLVTRFGFKPLLTAGMAISAGALVWFAQIDAAGSYVSDVLPPAVLMGAAIGTTFVATLAAATDDLGGGESGLGSGLVNATQQVGGALGLAVLSAVAFARVDDALAPTPPDPHALQAALTEGFQLAFYVGAGLAVLGMVIALLVVTRPRAGKPAARAAQDQHSPPDQPSTRHDQAQPAGLSETSLSADGHRPADQSNDRFQLAVIVGSTREGRFAPVVANWFVAQAEQRADLTVDVIDLAEVPLPTVQQAHPVPTGEYTSPQVRAFAARIGVADAFVVVTPEYNHGYPGPLKLALDSVYPEWHAKPVGFVAYGGLAGGLRSVEQLRLVFAELHAVTIPETVSFYMALDQFDQNGQLRDPDGVNAAATTMLDRLAWWAYALRAARAARSYRV